MAAGAHGISEDDKRRSTRMAARAFAGVAVFAAAFIAVCLGIGALAGPRQVADTVQLSAVEQQDPFYVLLIGSDSRKGTALYTGKASDHAQVNQHSDVITLVRVDPASYQITLVTVPRDTVLPGESSKINDTLVNGDPMETVNAVQRLTGVEIDYYMMTTFTGFENFIDALGGVTVDVPATVKVPDPSTAEDVTVQKGQNQHLDGSETLVFARARKVLNMPNESDIDQALVNLKRSTSTNLDMSKVGYLAVDFALHKDDVTLYSCTGPYTGDVNSSGLWVVDQNSQAWEDLMAAVDSGSDPSGIVEGPAMP